MLRRFTCRCERVPEPLSDSTPRRPMTQQRHVSAIGYTQVGNDVGLNANHIAKSDGESWLVLEPVRDVPHVGDATSRVEDSECEMMWKSGINRPNKSGSRATFTQSAGTPTIAACVRHETVNRSTDSRVCSDTDHPSAPIAQLDRATDF